MLPDTKNCTLLSVQFYFITLYFMYYGDGSRRNHMALYIRFCGSCFSVNMALRLRHFQSKESKTASTAFRASSTDVSIVMLMVFISAILLLPAIRLALFTMDADKGPCEATII